jgi:HAE1 family hydrophobic/amphiphilic exporter-1
MDEERKNLPRKTPDSSIPSSDDGVIVPHEFTPPEAQIKDNAAIKFSVSRYVLSLGVFIAFVVFGAIAAIGLGVNLLPNFDIPTVTVTTTDFGASPEDMDKQVTRPIEDAVSTIAGVSDISSTSANGLSQVFVSFGSGVDTVKAASEVSQKVAGIRGLLPQTADSPNVQRFNPNDQPIMRVAVSGGGAGLRDVFTYADTTLRDLLERQPGVADISISGAPAREIQVLLDPAKLAAFNLSPARVTGALRASARDSSAGNVSSNGSQITITSRNVPTTLAQIEQILVDSASGTRIADIATVRDTTADATSFARLNGQPVVLLSIRKVSGSSTVGVAGAVRSAVNTAQLPAGYTAVVSNDTSTGITNSVNDTLKEGLLVAAAVTIICLITLGKLNTAFAVVLAIPISLSAAPVIFAIFGFTFNIITLLALIVAMGIVVDDSIVVAENVERYREQGYGLIQSVLKGSSEVFSAVAASTFSLLAVLIPLAFIPGILGQFFKEFSLGLAAAILFSWLEALFFLTVRMAYTPDPEPLTWRGFLKVAARFPSSLRWAWRAARSAFGITALVVVVAAQAVPLYLRIQNNTPSSTPLFVSITILVSSIVLYPVIIAVVGHVLVTLLAFINALANWLFILSDGALKATGRSYARGLRRSLKFNGWVLVGAIVFMLSIGIAGTRLQFSFTPREDASQASIRLTLPAGTTLTETDRAARRVEDYLSKRPEIKQIATTVGTANAFGGGGVQARAALISLDLQKKGQRPTIFELLPTWTNDLKVIFRDRPEITINVAAAQNGPGDSADLTLNFASSTQSALVERIPQIVALVRQDKNVVSVDSSINQTTLEQAFVPDLDQLKGTGLTPDDVTGVIAIANQGVRAGDFRDGDETFDIRTRIDPALVSDPQSLLALPVYSNVLQANIPVSDLGRFELRQSPSTISRFAKAYSATINLTLQKGVSGFAARGPIEKAIRDAKLVDDTVRFGGGSSFGSAALLGNLFLYGPIAILVALLLNYLVLGSQFNSFRYPVYLLLPVPLALVGAVWGLVLFGTPLDIITLLGMVTLVGLVTKNAILLLDFVVERARAMPLADALVEAAQLRLRPIFMTTVTVFVISIPLILGTGEGSEFRKGLGIVIFAGILTSTILTLFVVPSAFYRFEKNRIQRRERPEGGALVPSVVSPSAAPSAAD